MKKLVFVLFLVSGTSCETAFIEREPENTYLENFEVFWNEFDRNYSFFEIKNIDWDSVYLEYRPLVEEAESDEYFFFLLGQMANSLRDGHVNVISPYGRSYYDFSRGAPRNEPYQAANYLFNRKKIANTIDYAEIGGHNVGYVYIRSFGNDLQDYIAIEEVLEEFREKDGLIIDIRSNGGGNTSNSQAVASRFADRERPYLKIKYKDGPGHNDFTEWTTRTVKPEGNVQYLKPVAILTNRKTYSAAEDFLLAMRLFPHVTIVGDTTGGGSGNPIFRELPNGWIFRLSSWIAADPDGVSFEERGIYPNVPLWNFLGDSLRGRDRILEQAIFEVEKWRN